MKAFRSRPAVAAALAATLSMVATPAMARGWGGGGWGRHHRHHDRVDAGDVLAGVLIIGGIAAIASAASNSAKQKREREQDYRYPDGDYRSDSGREDSGRYGDYNERNDDRGGGSAGYRSADGLNAAVDRCVGEVERGERRVDTVDSVDRDASGWRVAGRTNGGRDFACTVDGDGRIRSVTIDGSAA